jgi:hypothetical protein
MENGDGGFHFFFLQLESVRPGDDVMITIFCDFGQFSAKKLAFFTKTNVVIKILHNLALCFESKTPIFCRFFWRKLKKS